MQIILKRPLGAGIKDDSNGLIEYLLPLIFHLITYIILKRLK